LFIYTAAARAQDDPAAAGPHRVTSHVLKLTVNGGKRTFFDVRLPDAPGPRPVVVICHGWAAHAPKFARLADHLASRGFAAALFEQPDAWGSSTPRWATQLEDGLAALARSNDDPQSPLRGRLDLGRLALLGHSYGAAASLVVAGRDPRVDAVVALAPVNQPHRGLVLESAGRLRAPLLVMAGQWDWVATNKRHTRAYYRAATRAAARQYLEVRLGGHDLYTKGGEKERLTRRYATAWLERFLGVASHAALTDGSAARADLAAKRFNLVEVDAPAGLAGSLGAP
jgi:alpha-beta hydrolase superfamily lysophospholipase